MEKIKTTKLHVTKYISEVADDIWNVIDNSKGKYICLIAPPGIGKTRLSTVSDSGRDIITAMPMINGIVAQAEVPVEQKYYAKNPIKADQKIVFPALSTYDQLAKLSLENVTRDTHLFLDESHRLTTDDFRSSIPRALEVAMKVAKKVIFMSGTLDVEVFQDLVKDVIIVTQDDPVKIDLQVVHTQTPDGHKMGQFNFVREGVDAIHSRGNKALVLMQDTQLCKKLCELDPDHRIWANGNESSKTQMSHPYMKNILDTGDVPREINLIVGTSVLVEAWTLNHEDGVEWEVLIASNSATQHSLASATVVEQLCKRMRNAPYRIQCSLQVSESLGQLPIKYDVKMVDNGHNIHCANLIAQGSENAEYSKYKINIVDDKPSILGRLQVRQRMFNKSISYHPRKPQAFLDRCTFYDINATVVNFEAEYMEHKDNVHVNKVFLQMIDAWSVPTQEDVKKMFDNNVPKKVVLVDILENLLKEYKVRNTKAKPDLYPFAAMWYKYGVQDEIVEHLSEMAEDDKGELQYKRNGVAGAYEKLMTELYSNSYLKELRLAVWKKHRGRPFTAKELRRWMNTSVTPKHFSRFKQDANVKQAEKDKKVRTNKDNTIAALMRNLVAYECVGRLPKKGAKLYQLLERPLPIITIDDDAEMEYGFVYRLAIQPKAMVYRSVLRQFD